jgi:hypothetical protein
MLKLIMDILGVSKQTILQTLSQLTVQFMDSQSTIYTKHASKSMVDFANIGMHPSSPRKLLVSAL